MLSCGERRAMITIQQIRQMNPNIQPCVAGGARRSGGGLGGASRSGGGPGGTRQPGSTSQADKTRAVIMRTVALTLWIIAICLEAFALGVLLQRDPPAVQMAAALLVVDAFLAVIATVLWSNANRRHLALRRHKMQFFIQNRLGLILAVLAFPPLVLILLTGKRSDKAFKAAMMIFAALLLAVAAYLGLGQQAVPQAEIAATQQTVQTLTGADRVHWTANGTRLHLYADCSHISTSRTVSVSSGSVAEGYRAIRCTDICKSCYNRAGAQSGAETSQLLNQASTIHERSAIFHTQICEFMTESG